MHRGHLLSRAHRQIAALAGGFVPQETTGNVYATGSAGRAILEALVAAEQAAGRLTAHDTLMAQVLIRVLTGGDHTGFQDETTWLDLEREGFLRLIGTPATQARMESMLTHGKPLRN
jgi:3-hydroxyacyl-CoA dehydrogenase